MIFLMRFIVSGHSMEPTLKPGQTVLVSSISYLLTRPKVGDIVVVKNPNQDLILKRIAKEKKGKFFVSGDNPRDSTDSRTFGTVERNQVIGKVILAV